MRDVKKSLWTELIARQKYGHSVPRFTIFHQLSPSVMIGTRGSDIQSHTHTRHYCIYIRLVQSNNATFGKWPDWSYCHSVVAETLSFPTVYHTLSKSGF